MRYQKFILVLFSISFSFLFASAQDKEIDSLINLIQSAKDDSNKVNTLIELSKKYINSEPDKCILYGQKARDLAIKINFKRGLGYAYKYIGYGNWTKGEYIETLKQDKLALDVFNSIGDKKGIANIYSNMANVYYNKGDDDMALELFLIALGVAEKNNDDYRVVEVLGNIGAIYGKKKQTYDKAIEYYRRAYPLSLELKNDVLIGNNAVNLGEVYMNMSVFDSALHYYNISLNIFAGTADAPYTMNDIGALYMLQNEYDKAIKIQKEAYAIAEKFELKYDMGIALVGLAKSYLAKGSLPDALQTFNQAEKVASEIRANNALLEIYTGLSQVYIDKKDFTNASKYQKLLLDIKDTIYNIETDKKLGTLQFTYELQERESRINLLTKDQEIKQKEISRQKIVRNSLMGGFAVVLIFAGIFFMQRNKIRVSKKRSDELLLDILPESTAEELKATGTAKAKSFESVSVMFTDFKNFTQASEKLSAEELVKEIDYCFSVFDKIVSIYGIEKIKTIGDSYMCACGLPVPKANHADSLIRAGLEMQAFIERNKNERKAKNLVYFELRVGIHSGPVVAGVVGTKKFAYDIWGDTVNTASRMESSGEVGKVNISGSTYELTKNKFTMVHRGKIEAKNKGQIDMYFVEN